MKCLVPIPPETVTSLKREKETGLGYQIICVVLKEAHALSKLSPAKVASLPFAGCRSPIRI